MSSHSFIKRICATLALLVTCNIVLAEQAIKIRFAEDSTSGQETLNAHTVFDQHGAALRTVLLSFHDYADLHPWITEATLTSPIAGEKSEFLIQFKFPWPIGQRWSRVEVSTDQRNSINWHQVEGSMKANAGQLKFVASGQGIRVDYSAVINAGLPNALTRGFKKRFVREFIAAAHTRATELDATGLRFADSSSNR